MDWKLLLTTFVTVFVAELGDKTQLATFGLAGSSQSRLSVFLGSALALLLSTAIAVVAGDALARRISPLWLQRGAAVLFVLLGILAGYVSALAFRHAACKFKRCPGKGNRARPQVERRGRLPLEDVQDIPCFQGRTDPAADGLVAVAQ